MCKTNHRNPIILKMLKSKLAINTTKLQQKVGLFIFRLLHNEKRLKKSPKVLTFGIKFMLISSSQQWRHQQAFIKFIVHCALKLPTNLCVLDKN